MIQKTTPASLSRSLLAALSLAGVSLLGLLGACSGADDTPGDGPPSGSSGTSGSSGSSGTSGTSGTSGEIDAASPDGSPGDGAAGDGGADGGFTYVPVPEGCINDVSAGDHVYTCEGLSVEATIPPLAAKCPAAGCGVIVELHGDTGTAALIDAHLRLRARAAPRGYIVIAPTGPAIGTINGTLYPGSSWQPAQDAKVVAITQLFAKVFKANPKRIHATGFSRGGFMTWRLACDHSTLFASVAPGAAGNANTFLTVNAIEPTCFTPGRAPARPIPILELMGQTDVPVSYASMVSIKNAALAQYGIAQGQTVAVQTTAQFVHMKTNKVGAPTVEWFDHKYETLPTGPAAAAKGHCVPGSTYNPNATQYAYACNPNPANGFDWGAEVLAFFERNPMP